MSETPVDSSKRTWIITSACAGAVGGVAAAVSVQLRSMGLDAKLIVVEPDEAACLLKSAQAGALSVVEGDLPTLMAGPYRQNSA